MLARFFCGFLYTKRKQNIFSSYTFFLTWSLCYHHLPWVKSWSLEGHYNHHARRKVLCAYFKLSEHYWLFFLTQQVISLKKIQNVEDTGFHLDPEKKGCLTSRSSLQKVLHEEITTIHSLSLPSFSIFEESCHDPSVVQSL